MSEKGEIILYQTEDGLTRLDVRLVDEKVWLFQKLMAELFDNDVRIINEHICNIFSESELQKDSVIRNFRITAKLDDFMRLSDREVLTHTGRISAKTARLKAEAEYDQFRRQLDTQPSQVDRHFQETVAQAKQIEVMKPRGKKDGA